MEPASWPALFFTTKTRGHEEERKGPDQSHYVFGGVRTFPLLGMLGYTMALLAPLHPAVLPVAVEGLRIVSLGFVFYAWGMVTVQSLNGAGDTWTPTKINLFCFWFWEIPLAYFLAVRAGLGPRGVFIAITVAFSTIAVVGILVFRRGRWKEKKV